MAKSVLFYNSGKSSVGAVKFDLLLEEHHSLKSIITQHPVEGDKAVADGVIRELRTGSLKGLVSNHSLSTATELPDNVKKLLGPSASQYAGFAASVGVGLLGGALSSQSDAVQKVGSVALGAGILAASRLTRRPSEAAIKEALASLGRPANRARDAWTLFNQLWLSGEPVLIISGLMKSEKLMVTNVDTALTTDTGECLEFDVQFSEYRVVSSRKIALPLAIAPKLTTPEGKQASPKANAGRTTGTGKTTGASKAALTTKVVK